MATLRAARQTYKDTRRTNDVWCIRIKRQDGVMIHFTNAASNIVVSSRVLADGTTEALASDVTYYSLTNHNPTAVSKPKDREPGAFDFEVLLDKTTASGSRTTSTQYTIASADVTANRQFGSNGPEVIVDGLKSSGSPAYNFSSSINVGTNANPDYVDIDLRVASVVNKVSVYLFERMYLSVHKSDDGKRYDEIIPLIEYNAGNSFAQVDITLPTDVKSRFFRVYFGTSTNQVDLVEIELVNDQTFTTTGTITRKDIENGLFANAEVFLFLTENDTPFEDDEKVISGFIKNIEMRDGSAVFQIAGKLEALTYITGRLFQPACDAEFGSFRCGIHLDPPDWSADTYVIAKSASDAASGSWVNANNGFFAFCSMTGLTDPTTEPVWPSSAGATVTDNAAEWTMVRAFKLTGQAISVVTSLTNITVPGVATDADDTWTAGKLIFETGDLAGVEIRIKDQTGGVLTLPPELRNLPAVSDTVTLIQGCRKRLSADCDTKFDNVRNFQGFPYIPGAKAIGKFGGQE